MLESSSALANGWRMSPTAGFLSPYNVPFLPDFTLEYESGDADTYPIETGCDAATAGAAVIPTC